MPALDRLSAEDRLILWPDPVWPQDIGVVGVLDGSSLLDSDGRFRIEVATQAIEGRLHLLGQGSVWITTAPSRASLACRGIAGQSVMLRRE